LPPKTHKTHIATYNIQQLTLPPKRPKNTHCHLKYPTRHIVT